MSESDEKERISYHYGFVGPDDDKTESPFCGSRMKTTKKTNLFDKISSFQKCIFIKFWDVGNLITDLV